MSIGIGRFLDTSGGGGGDDDDDALEGGDSRLQTVADQNDDDDDGPGGTLPPSSVGYSGDDDDSDDGDVADSDPSEAPSAVGGGDDGPGGSSPPLEDVGGPGGGSSSVGPSRRGADDRGSVVNNDNRAKDSSSTGPSRRGANDRGSSDVDGDPNPAPEGGDARLFAAARNQEQSAATTETTNTNDGPKNQGPQRQTIDLVVTVESTGSNRTATVTVETSGGEVFTETTDTGEAAAFSIASAAPMALEVSALGATQVVGPLEPGSRQHQVVLSPAPAGAPDGGSNPGGSGNGNGGNEALRQRIRQLRRTISRTQRTAAANTGGKTVNVTRGGEGDPGLLGTATAFASANPATTALGGLGIAAVLYYYYFR